MTKRSLVKEHQDACLNPDCQPQRAKEYCVPCREVPAVPHECPNCPQCGTGYCAHHGFGCTADCKAGQFGVLHDPHCEAVWYCDVGVCRAGPFTPAGHLEHMAVDHPKHRYEVV